MFGLLSVQNPKVVFRGIKEPKIPLMFNLVYSNSQVKVVENEEEEIRDTICQESSATIVRPRNKIGRFQAGQFISV